MSAEQVAHVQAQVLRFVRLGVFVLMAQPAVSALFASTLARYPAAAALVAAAEVVFRYFRPVKPLPSAVEAVLKPPSPPPAG